MVGKGGEEMEGMGEGRREVGYVRGADKGREWVGEG